MRAIDNKADQTEMPSTQRGKNLTIGQINKTRSNKIDCGGDITSSIG